MNTLQRQMGPPLHLFLTLFFLCPFVTQENVPRKTATPRYVYTNLKSIDDVTKLNDRGYNSLKEPVFVVINSNISLEDSSKFKNANKTKPNHYLQEVYGHISSADCLYFVSLKRNLMLNYKKLKYLASLRENDMLFFTPSLSITVIYYREDQNDLNEESKYCNVSSHMSFIFSHNW